VLKKSSKLGSSPSSSGSIAAGSPWGWSSKSDAALSSRRVMISALSGIPDILPPRVVTKRMGRIHSCLPFSSRGLPRHESGRRCSPSNGGSGQRESLDSALTVEEPELAAAGGEEGLPGLLDFALRRESSERLALRIEQDHRARLALLVHADRESRSVE